MDRPPLFIDHISLLVTSFEHSMPYYDKLLPLLGFRKLRPHVWAGKDGFHFQFREAHDDTRPYERWGAGMNHLGFTAPSRQFVDDVAETMAAAGFPVPERQEFNDTYALFMKDPDGIRFEITHYAPGNAVVD